MTTIKLESYESQLKSCNLNRIDLEKRINYLKNDLFSKATTITENKSTITLEFPFKRDYVNEIVDLAFFEKNCCGNFIIDVQFNMIDNILKVELKLMK